MLFEEDHWIDTLQMLRDGMMALEGISRRQIDYASYFGGIQAASKFDSEDEEHDDIEYHEQ